jgi:glycosyltransferase involved in cell wall biosynthesis
MVKTIIVIPCYNEASRLPVERLRDYGASERGVRFVLVDDGSTDGTLERLNELERGHPNAFQVLRLSRNLGKGEAVRQGILKAWEQETDYVGFWDADLSTPLEAIDEMREVLESDLQLEMVFASRVKLLGRSIERRLVRHYAGRVFATLSSTLLRLPVYDTQCGAKIFRKSATTKALFMDSFVSRWIFDVECIARLIQMRRGTELPQAEEIIYEYPLRSWQHKRGSKLRPRDLLRVGVDLVRIHRRYLRGRGATRA